MNKFNMVFEYSNFITFRTRFYNVYDELAYAYPEDIEFIIEKYVSMIESELLPHVENAGMKAKGEKIAERLKNAPATYYTDRAKRDQENARIRQYKGAWIYKKDAEMHALNDRKSYISNVLDEVLTYTEQVMLDYRHTRGLV